MKIAYLKSHQDLPGANDLMHSEVRVWSFYRLDDVVIRKHFKTLLTLWTENPPVNYGLMLRRTVVRSIGVVSLNKRWFETPQCKPKQKLPLHVFSGV